MGDFYDSEAFAGTRDERSLAEFALESLLGAKKELKRITLADIFGGRHAVVIRRGRMDNVQTYISYARRDLESFCKQKNIDVTLGVADINEMSSVPAVKKQIDRAIERVTQLIEEYK